MEEIPFGTLTFAKDKNEGEPDYYVYPSMTETIGLLADAGMKSRQQAVRADTRITISTPELYYFLQGEGLVEGTDVPEVTYTGEKAGQLLEAAAPSDWMWENTMVLKRENKIDFVISVSGGPDENGNETLLEWSKDNIEAIIFPTKLAGHYSIADAAKQAKEVLKSRLSKSYYGQTKEILEEALTLYFEAHPECQKPAEKNNT